MKRNLKTIARRSAGVLAMFALLVGAYLIFELQNLQAESAGRRSTEAVAVELVERELLPSISFAVIENGQIGDVQTVGIADSATGERVTGDTLYEAASLTKPVVAELARRLYNQGLFDLDEAVSDTISLDRISSQVARERITPRHLLSHSSGLPNWSGDNRNPARTDVLDVRFEPGSAFQYSGEGYGILLTFLEAKSGRTADTLAGELFRELGMANSTLVGRGHRGHFARGHWGVSPDRQPWKTPAPVAAYSLFTNANDYARFIQYVMRNHATGLTSGDPFSAVHINIDSATTDQNTETLGWSLGWGTLQQKDRTIYFQWGDNGAFRSFAAFDPKTGNAIVYFTNGSFGTLFADELAEPVLGDISMASSWFASPPKEIARTWLRY
ncbi:MAG: beta-lactamase family protein [Alphaproteobacteria bacterium]|nr:beta-lactamase family protein [Alphaproteobacteria bacterium]